MDAITGELFKQGGGYLLAGLAILVIKWIADARVKDALEHQGEIRSWAERERTDKEMERADKLLLLQALQNNTATMTKLALLIEASERVKARRSVQGGQA